MPGCGQAYDLRVPAEPAGRSGREQGMRPSHWHVHREVTAGISCARTPGALARPGVFAPGATYPGAMFPAVAYSGVTPSGALLPGASMTVRGVRIVPVGPRTAPAAGRAIPAVRRERGSVRSGTREGPGARRRRGRSSPALTWSPELSRSVPADPCPRVVRFPEKVSPGEPSSILNRCHSNVGCCEPEAGFRIKVR